MITSLCNHIVCYTSRLWLHTNRSISKSTSAKAIRCNMIMEGAGCWLQAQQCLLRWYELKQKHHSKVTNSQATAANSQTTCWTVKGSYSVKPYVL
jgi:hypothetical protein